MRELKRVYSQINISNLTLEEIYDIILQEQISYSVDYGFKNTDQTRLVFSLN